MPSPMTRMLDRRWRCSKARPPRSCPSSTTSRKWRSEPPVPASHHERKKGDGMGEAIHQLIPLRRPPVEVWDVEQAGWRHYRVSRGLSTIGESGHLTTTIVPLPADTWSRSLCWLLATLAGIESGPTLGNRGPRKPNRPRLHRSVRHTWGAPATSTPAPRRPSWCRWGSCPEWGPCGSPMPARGNLQVEHDLVALRGDASAIAVHQGAVDVPVDRAAAGVHWNR